VVFLTSEKQIAASEFRLSNNLKITQNAKLVTGLLSKFRQLFSKFKKITQNAQLVTGLRVGT
jgi:hypothetical protein